MKTLIRLSAAVFLAASSAVHAADVISLPTSTPVAVPVHDTAEPFDWSGFYAGVYGAARIVDGQNQLGLGLQAGVNAQFDFVLLGAEVQVEGLNGDVGDTSYGQLLGRAGLVATDDVVVYAAGGYGIDLGNPQMDSALAGAGVEVAITDTISLEAEYLRSFSFDEGEPADSITFGANFHF